MATNSTAGNPFTFRFVDRDSTLQLELVNASAHPLKSVEVLTIFLKDEETPGGGPSQAHIKFETIKSVQAQESVVLLHRTWINGKPVDSAHDKLERLRVIAGASVPYVLDISWEDPEGKTRFQRIPLGH